MNRLTDLYQLDGKSMLAPDADVEMEFSDLDSADAGRDESGYLHRSVIRRMVGVWNFAYAHLTGEEYRYMLSILPQGGTFDFTYPDPATGGQNCPCLPVELRHRLAQQPHRPLPQSEIQHHRVLSV